MYDRVVLCFFFSSRRRHTRFDCDWSSDVCSSDLVGELLRRTGGRLFDAEGRPPLTEKPVLELLDFYKKLGRVLPPGWTGHSYLDTFANLANDKAAMLYQAYGRGVGYIEKYAAKDIADPDHFAVADKVVGPSGRTPARS